MLQFLYTIHPTRDGFLETTTPDEYRIVDEHFHYLERLARKGVVLLAGRTLNTDPSAFGIVIFEASSEADADRVMTEDPAVREGIFKATLFPYRIALRPCSLTDEVLRSASNEEVDYGT
jgi:uncharacterized protein YciI